MEAVRAWLAAAGITEGPVFRPVNRFGAVASEALCADSVPDLIKSYAQLAGLDPALFAGHSLRAGFLTSAAEAGATVFKMMEVSRHKSVDTLRQADRRLITCQPAPPGFRIPAHGLTCPADAPSPHP